MTATLCHVFCFSPTGGSLKIAGAVAEGTGLPRQLSDVTLPDQRAARTEFLPEALVVFAVPVYFGRVERHAAEAVASLQGQGQPAVLVVNYGNRHYDDALRELYDLAVKAGFVPVAAAAFVSEHSFSTPECPMAQGRPDSDDLERARRFGAEVAARLAGGAADPVSVPGAFPYKDYPDVHRAPVQNEDICTLCGLCESLCPVAAISIRDAAVHTDAQACILCQACVKGCPEGARSDSAPGAQETREHLAPLVRERREPEIFL